MEGDIKKSPTIESGPGYYFDNLKLRAPVDLPRVARAVSTGTGLVGDDVYGPHDAPVNAPEFDRRHLRDVGGGSSGEHASSFDAVVIEDRVACLPPVVRVPDQQDHLGGITGARRRCRVNGLRASRHRHFADARVVLAPRLHSDCRRPNRVSNDGAEEHHEYDRGPTIASAPRLSHCILLAKPVYYCKG